MSLFDFILSLLLVFNPSMSESTFDQVYSVLDDTQLRSVLVEDSAVEALSQLAGNAEIMPLEFGQSDSATLNSIYRMLYTNSTSNSVAYWSQTINQNLVNLSTKFSSFSTAFNNFSSDFDDHALKTSNIYDFLVSQKSELVKLFNKSNDYSADIWRLVGQISGQITDFASSNAGGWDKKFSVSVFDMSSWSIKSSSLSPLDVLSNFRNFVLQSVFLPKDSNILNWDGKILKLPFNMSFSALISHSFRGIAELMSGSDRSTTFSFLKDDLSGSDAISAGNLLDAFGHVGTKLQNPLQRLAYVLANPQDIQIREDVSGNVDQAQEDFFKSDGGGSVKPADIKDAAGISGGAAGALESPGSVGDLTAQINNQDNFSFFSDVTLGNLDSVPVTHSEDDDFIDFYDPSNPALWEALSNESVS